MNPSPILPKRTLTAEIVSLSISSAAFIQSDVYLAMEHGINEEKVEEMLLIVYHNLNRHTIKDEEIHSCIPSAHPALRITRSAKSVMVLRLYCTTRAPTISNCYTVSVPVSLYVCFVYVASLCNPVSEDPFQDMPTMMGKAWPFYTVQHQRGSTCMCLTIPVNH